MTGVWATADPAGLAWLIRGVGVTWRVTGVAC